MKRTLATIAATAAVLALFARQRPSQDLSRLSRAIAREEDHVTREELAKMRQVRLIDVRKKEEFDRGHVTKAENIPIENIASVTFDPKETVVLLSEGGAHAAQAWVILQLRGYRNVFFLRNGTAGVSGGVPAGGRKYEPGKDGC